MPLYDFECPHNHRFDRQCLIADMHEPVPCEGRVNQLILDDEAIAKYEADPALPLPDDWKWVQIDDGPSESLFSVPLEKGEEVSIPGKCITAQAAQRAQREVLKRTVETEADRFLVKVISCGLKASLVMGRHNNPGGALNHNTAANRDAAREGRYDPLNPSRKTMAKGRVWRK